MTTATALEIGQYRKDRHGDVFCVEKFSVSQDVEYVHATRPDKFKPRDCFRRCDFEAMTVVDRPYWDDERIEDELSPLIRKRLALKTEIDASQRHH